MTLLLQFFLDSLRCLVHGNRRYWSWVLCLSAIMGAGTVAYLYQLHYGLQVTNLTDQVSWGAYIANFTFLVGVAAAAVLLVVPSYIYKRNDMKKVVLIGELLAVSSMLMCLAFVTVDLGRPDRFLHLLPVIGRLNFPQSMLAWDIIVLNVYLLLNIFIPGYILYQRYLGRRPKKSYYMPWVYLSIFWAISIHTVTAFLFTGMGSRPFWNTSILAARFLIGAFASGPAILLIAFYFIHHSTAFSVPKSVFETLKKIMAVTLPINLFLFGCEVFKEFYTDNEHALAIKYLFFGIHGHGLLVPFAWAALVFNILSTIIFVTPQFRNQTSIVAVGALITIVGVWIEKGMGLLIPGFIPTPLGDLVEYSPSLVETVICLGIWAMGMLVFTMLVKIAVNIDLGHIRLHPKDRNP